MSEGLIGRQVALTTPEGDVYRFVVRSLQPYAGETYAVLEEEKLDGQMLITHI